MRNYRKMNGTPNLPHRKPTFWEIAAALLAKAPMPLPLWRKDEELPAGNSGGSSAGGDKLPKGSASGAAAYNRNAMNFLPGAIVHNIYGNASSQRSAEDRAAAVLERRGNEQLLAAAKARGYTG